MLTEIWAVFNFQIITLDIPCHAESLGTMTMKRRFWDLLCNLQGSIPILVVRNSGNTVWGLPALVPVPQIPPQLLLQPAQSPPPALPLLEMWWRSFGWWRGWGESSSQILQKKQPATTVLSFFFFLLLLLLLLVVVVVVVEVHVGSHLCFSRSLNIFGTPPGAKPFNK